MIVLITGCSSGFGLLSAARLAAAGATIYATMRNLASQTALQAEVKRRGGQVRILALDVTDDATIAEAVAQIQREQGKLDVLINNAGYGLGGALEDLLESELRAQMETNFFGVAKMIQACLPLLRKGQSAKIINISSVAGLVGVPGIGAYSASKFALEGYSEALWYELGTFGISVSLIEPGTYPTEVQKKRILTANFSNPNSHYLEENKTLLEATDRRVARGKANPEEVAILIEQIVNNPKPKLRYPIGREAKAMTILRRLAPFRTVSRVLTRALFR